MWTLLPSEMIMSSELQRRWGLKRELLEINFKKKPAVARASIYAAQLIEI